MERPQKVYTRGYDGPATERTAADCAKEWKKLGLGNIDSLLVEQLKSASSRGEKSITVLEIGSGAKGQLLRSVIYDPMIASETRTYLSEHQEMSLNLVGVTDVQKVDELGKPIDQIHIQEDEMRGQLRNIGYTLTASQTLEQFCQEQGIATINLALATWSLAYLPPNIFREVVTTTTKRLSQQGRFIGVGYTDEVSGIGFKYHPESEPGKDIVHFAIRSQKLPEHLWETLFDELPESRRSPLLRRKRIENIKEYLRKVTAAHTLSLEPQTQQEIIEIIDNAEQLRDLKGAAQLLKTPMRRLWEREFRDVFKPKKEAVIQEIGQNTNSRVEVTNSAAFVIQRA